MEGCLVYQKNKLEIVKTPSLLQPLAIPCQCWEEVSMYFIKGLPKPEGNNAIIVIVNRLTKYAHLYSLLHGFKTCTVDAAFMDIVQKLHGNRNII